MCTYLSINTWTQIHNVQKLAIQTPPTARNYNSQIPYITPYESDTVIRFVGELPAGAVQLLGHSATPRYTHIQCKSSTCHDVPWNSFIAREYLLTTHQHDMQLILEQLTGGNVNGIDVTNKLFHS